MKTKALLTSLALMILMFCGVFVRAQPLPEKGAAIEDYSGYLPAVALGAIKKSQGEVVSVVPFLDGHRELMMGQGFLISDDEVITALHLMPEQTDVVLAPGRITFNSIPARLVWWDRKGDVAILKLTQKPKEMSPVIFSPKTDLFSETYALVKTIPSEENPDEVNSFYLPRQAKIAAKVNKVVPKEIFPGLVTFSFYQYFYLDQAIKPGFSGAMFVNAKGEVVGMGQAIEGGYSIILGAPSLIEAIGNYRAAQKNAKLSFENLAKIQEAQEILGEIMALYAVNALEQPRDLTVCAREMFAMRPSGDCRDRFSRYLSPEEAKAENEENKGEYIGIGVEMAMQQGKVMVITAFAGTSAERAGIKPGDILLEIDGKEVRTPKQAWGLLDGEAGTEVEILAERDGQRIKFTLIREKIIVPSVQSSILANSEAVGLIEISEFDGHTAQNFKEKFQKFQESNLKVIIDLRDNLGGSLEAALEMLALFMGPDDIAITVRTKNETFTFDRKYLESKYQISDFGKFRGAKVVILINGGSASASEIFAGAMKDWGYKIVGEKSFGKGVGQTPFNLNDGSQLVLTTVEFLVGNGRVPIQDKGVLPDFEIKNREDSKEDLQLKKALEVLKSE